MALHLRDRAFADRVFADRVFANRVFAVVAALAAGLVLLLPSTASAHSLNSSTISVHVNEDSVDARVSVALEALDKALGTAYSATAADVDVDEYADEIIDYLDAHVAVTGADGTTWPESYDNPVRGAIEGIESFSVDVAFDTHGADPSSFTIVYDAIIEADPTHTAVVVLTDAAGEISTPGVLDASDTALRLGDHVDVGLADMVGYGYQHVLEGADHLLFLLALLLVAPLVVAGRRWRRRDGVVATWRTVVHVVTSFTIGHSLALIASALGWVALPSTLVEVLIAVSVGVSAVHAIRPLARHGEVAIAGAFGLVHGLAFAGILTDLGLAGSTSLLALLAFNVGVELAQLAAVVLVFPSIHLAARTRFYPVLRLVGGLATIAIATGWAVERLGVVTNPLAPVEQALISHRLWVAVALAMVAVCCWLIDRRTLVDGGDGVSEGSVPGAEAASPKRDRSQLTGQISV